MGYSVTSPCFFICELYRIYKSSNQLIVFRKWNHFSCWHKKAIISRKNRYVWKTKYLKDIIYWHLNKVKLFSIAAAKSLQSCPTLCDPRDGSPPGSCVPEILKARTLEWVATAFSSVWKWKVKVKSFSRVRLLVTPWTAAYQAPPSMGFSRQEYWSGVPLPSLTIYP